MQDQSLPPENDTPNVSATEAQATEAQATEAQATEAQATEAQATNVSATEAQATEGNDDVSPPSETVLNGDAVGQDADASVQPLTFDTQNDSESDVFSDSATNDAESGDAESGDAESGDADGEAAPSDAPAPNAPDSASEGDNVQGDNAKTVETAHQAAMRLARAFRSVVPIDPQTKRPFGSWKDAQASPTSLENVRQWAINQRDSFAMVCGAVSGGKNEQGDPLYMTCIDFDVLGFYEAWSEKVGDLANDLPLQRTGGGGHQVFFRSPVLVRNEKLAWSPSEKEETGREIAIETRGEGGYAVLAPSRHPSGNRYRWIGSGDAENVPAVGEVVALALLEAARTLDRAPQTKQDAEKQAKRAGAAKPKTNRAGKQGKAIVEAFNAAHSIESMLEKHGYTRVGAPTSDRFARPGSRSPSVFISENRSFHHSSNDPLSDGHHHSAFDVFCHFEHGGDFKAALRSAADELGLPLNTPASASAQQQQDELQAQLEAQAQALGLPLIEVNGRQLQDKLRDLRAALIQYNAAAPRLFRGPDGLVTVSNRGNEKAAFKRISAYGMQVVASGAAFWVGTNGRGVTEQIDPPRELSENLLASPDHWDEFPLLERVATAPFFGSNGELCDRSGFYPEARTWLALPEDFDLGDTTPTAANIAAALHMLFETILGEVSLEDQASRAHALALMILPFIRLLIHGPTPLHMVMAPEVSSGKSYLVHICLMAFTPPVPTAEKGNIEEWRKSLMAKLVTGSPVVWLDNIKRNLDSSTLDMALTSPSGYIEDRLTGTGLNVQVPVWIVWVATANNITLTPDAASRAVVISVVPSCEKPSEREYKGDPEHFILKNRGAVCGAIITLVRAWQEAGCPNYSGKFRTRFPAWTKIMGGILETVGVPGFLENLAKQRDLMSDDTDEAWSEFVSMWHNNHGISPMSARDLLPLALRVAVLSASLAKVEGDAKERRWAQLLVKQRNRIFAGLKITDGPVVQRKKTYVLSALTPLGQTPPGQTPPTQTVGGAGTDASNHGGMGADPADVNPAGEGADPIGVTGFVPIIPEIPTPPRESSDFDIGDTNISMAHMSLDEFISITSPHLKTEAPQAQVAAPQSAPDADNLVPDAPETPQIASEGNPSAPSAPENVGDENVDDETGSGGIGDAEPQTEVVILPETSSEESISSEVAPILESPILEPTISESEETEPSS